MTETGWIHGVLAAVRIVVGVLLLFGVAVPIFATLIVGFGVGLPVLALPEAANATKHRAQDHGGPARFLFDAANRERRARGLPELKWDHALALAAQRHADIMANKNTLSHQLPGEADPTTRARQAGALFSKIAENIGLAPNVEVIHEQWMKSPPHRANILDRELDSIGVAVVERNGRLFAAQDFSRAVATLSLGEQEKKIAALLAARGIPVNDVPNEVEAARQQCALQTGTPPNRRRVLVFRFTTSDLTRLPEALEQKLQSGSYHSAVVGACAPDKATPFTNYRLAVVLY